MATKAAILSKINILHQIRSRLIALLKFIYALYKCLIANPSELMKFMSVLYIVSYHVAVLNTFSSLCNVCLIFF
jgi:hypothetical protein